MEMSSTKTTQFYFYLFFFFIVFMAFQCFVNFCMSLALVLQLQQSAGSSKIHLVIAFPWHLENL